MNREQVQNHLECPVCFTVIKGSHVYICKNTHSVCGLCFYNLPLPKLCPSGRCSFETPAARNYEKEKMIEEFEFSMTCCNARKGCEERVEGVELQEHEEKCKHRMVPCPSTNCVKKIEVTELWKHLDANHAPRLCSYGKQTWRVTHAALSLVKRDIVGISFMEKEGERFFLQSVKRENVFMAWVKMEGSRREAVKWKFSIEVGDEEEMVISRHGSVYSVDMSLDEVLEARAYLVLGNNQARRIMRGKHKGDPMSVLGNIKMQFIVEKK